MDYIPTYSLFSRKLGNKFEIFLWNISSLTASCQVVKIVLYLYNMHQTDVKRNKPGLGSEKEMRSEKKLNK